MRGEGELQSSRSESVEVGRRRKVFVTGVYPSAVSVSLRRPPVERCRIGVE